MGVGRPPLNQCDQQRRPTGTVYMGPLLIITVLGYLRKNPPNRPSNLLHNCSGRLTVVASTTIRLFTVLIRLTGLCWNPHAVIGFSSLAEYTART